MGVLKMNEKNTSLIIANIFLVGAWLVDDVVGWCFMIGISLLWMVSFMIQANYEINQLRRQHARLEILHELMAEVEDQRDKATKKSRSKK
jgi:hypothetical protein